MAARTDCRHYSRRTTGGGDVVERCKLGVATDYPFDCPADCVFFEPRLISDAGWQRHRPPDEPRDE